MTPPDAPSDAGLDCESAIQRLVSCHESGERPGDDPRLAAHLGSCLACFRAAADLKDVPRLAGLLREDGHLAAARDPGPALWSSLPTELGQQFSQRRAPRTTGPVSMPLWQRFVRWIRMPVPAAMAGAACATAVALVMTRPPSIQTLGQRPAVVTETAGSPESEAAAEGSEIAAPGMGQMGQEDVAFAQSQSVYDSMEDLDSGALARVRDSFGSAVDEALTPHAQLAADDDDPGVGVTSTGPNPATVMDDLDQLDERGLTALRDQLGGAK